MAKWDSHYHVATEVKKLTILSQKAKLGQKLVIYKWVRSGMILVRVGYLRHAGIYAYDWSNSSSPSDYTYRFSSTSVDVRPSNGPGDRYNGFSLRCLQE